MDWRSSTDGQFRDRCAPPVTAAQLGNARQLVGRPIEWPTLAVAAIIYGGWALATYFHARIPPVLLFAVGGWLVAWHNSLQHEVIHGHPTPWHRLNRLLAAPPLSLWLPFEAYRRSHLAHHATEHLTDPRHDPESRYAEDGAGRALAFDRVARRLQSTMIGRLTLGPVFEATRFLVLESRRLLQGDNGGLRLWTVHLILVGLIWFWLHTVCRMSLADYLLFFIYPGAALSLIRSFAEHRADAHPAHRVAVVEDAPLLGLLFLNNNLHAAHHDRPGVAWYRLPAFYRRNRERLLRANGGLVYAGYADVFRRYLFQPHDRPHSLKADRTSAS